MMGVASLRTDSPAHIYEEIPHHLVEPTTGSSESSDEVSDSVNVTNFDFAQAKEFGSFLVVPIRSRVKTRTQCLTQLETNNNASEHSAPHCDTTANIKCHGMDPGYDTGSCTYPGGGGSSGDSAVADLSHDQHSDFLSQAHCGRRRRPHGIFNGVTLSHFGEELDPESVELQTYFNKQMLQQEEDNGNHDGSVVERFLIVPSRPQFTEDTQELTSNPQDQQANMVDNAQNNNQSDSLKAEPQQGSDSNDTGNEYDLRSSDQSSSSQSRPGSYAFDSGSSLYAFSNSSASGGSGTHKGHFVRHKPQESDSSNDTFSEYDLEKSPEYEYYLSKVQHNLWFKSDVMRVIRESESSEYETTSDIMSPRCQCKVGKSLDDISLTTVTSLSDLSLSDKDNEQTSKQSGGHSHHKESTKCTCDCQNQQFKPVRHKTKTKTRHSGRSRSERKHTKEQTAKTLMEVHVSDVPAWERTDRKGSHGSHAKHSSKKRSSSRKTAELYCLPDFSQPPAGNLVDDPERLSCRATDFTPPPVIASPRRHQQSQQNRTVTATDTQSALRHRRAPQQNRMLSDLMKMNHDRLLVLF